MSQKNTMSAQKSVKIPKQIMSFSVQMYSAQNYAQPQRVYMSTKSEICNSG